MKRLIALSLLTLLLTFTPAVIAQTPTRVRTATPSSTPKDILGEVKAKVATQVAEIKSVDKFVTGKITSIKDTTLQIMNPTGLVVSIQTSSSTKFLDLTAGKKTITLKTLKVGDLIAALGLTPGSSSGAATTVAHISSPKTRTTVVGTILNIQLATGSAALKTKTATDSAIVTLRLKTGTNSAVLVTGTTKLKINSLPNPTITDLLIGQRSVVTGPKGVDPITATILQVIGNNPLITPTPTKVSTTSATPTAVH